MKNYDLKTMKLLFALLVVTTTAFCQVDIDTLKLPELEVKKIESIDKELSQLTLTPQLQRYFLLQAIRETVIESGFNHAGENVPEKKEYNDQLKSVLYINDKKQKK